MAFKAGDTVFIVESNRFIREAEVTENKDALKGKKLAAFACQSGNGAEKAFIKLAKLIGIDSFDSTAVFVDPKSKPDEKKDAAIDSFCGVLKP